MIAATVRERLDRDPFEPFRIRLSSGDSYVVSDPHTVALLKSEVFIAFPNSDRLGLRAVAARGRGGGREGRRLAPPPAAPTLNPSVSRRDAAA